LFKPAKAPAVLTITVNPALDIAALTDRIEPARKLRCSDVRQDPGGGGINVARALTRLGAPCQALFPVGGPTGARLRQLVEAEGVVCLALPIAGDTREGLTVTERATGRQYRFVLPGPPLRADEGRALVARIEQARPRPRYVIASGSLPPGVGDDFFVTLAKAAAAVGARFVLDSSGPALGAALAHGVHIVKPNLRELEDLTGCPLPTRRAWEAAACRLVEDGKADIVALTLGADGAFLAMGDGRLRAGGLAVATQSAVGAGDSFLAALVHRLARGDGPETALRVAIAAGAAALMTPGTELFEVAEIDRLAPKVRIEAA